MGVVIQLFKDKPPAPEQQPEWEFCRDVYDNGLNNLAFLVESLEQAESEDEFRNLLRELKDEVGRWPDL